MKTASVRQIRLAFPSVLKAMREEGPIAITSRRKVVATLGPPPPSLPAERPWAGITQRLSAQPERKIAFADLLSADRDDVR